MKKSSQSMGPDAEDLEALVHDDTNQQPNYAI